MDTEFHYELPFVCLVLLVGLYIFRRNKIREERFARRRNRRWWVRPIYVPAMRIMQGAHDYLLREMRLSNPNKNTLWMRMTPEMFDKLLRLIGPTTTKQRLARTPIDPCTKLEIALRYLATGESMVSLVDQFRVGHSTVCGIISDTMKSVYDNLYPTVLKFPNENDFLQISEGFWKTWNFPHCGCN